MQGLFTTPGTVDIKKELVGTGYLLHIVNETLTMEQGEAFVKAFEAA